jgi:predicted nucleotidyltransferase component of viral defense system
MTPPAKPPSLPSLLAKFRNRAWQDGLPIDLMLLLYFYEGFLARLAASEFKDKLILKGGFNLYGRYQAAARPTRDVDLAGVQLTSGLDEVLSVVRTISKIDVADGILFDLTTLEGSSIMEGTNYGGVRAELLARYGTAFEKLTFDFSFGNAITPGPVMLEFPSLLGQPHILLAYPLETIVAEKSAAIVEIGITNTRLKDFYDLYYIAQHESRVFTSRCVATSLPAYFHSPRYAARETGIF